MQKIIALIVCWCWLWQASAQPNITAAEYFIDTDPGFGNATGIPITTPSSNITNQAFSVALGSVSQGVHALFLRSRNADGKWSVTNRFVFYKPSASAGVAAGNVNKAEYFFDTDPGFGNATNIPVTAGVNLQNINFAADITNLTIGVHSLFIRSRTVDGKWSITNRQVLYKPAGSAGGIASNIVKAEYFFDTDPGFGNAINIPLIPGIDVQNVNFAADLSALTIGVHSFFIRSRSANGKWSVTNRHILYKPNPANGLPPANITQVEYFIDTDPGFGRAVPIVVNPAATLADFLAPINISGLSVGDHKLFIRSKTDSAWSITNTYTFPIASTAASPFINVNAITKTVLCARDSVKLSFDARGTYNAGNVFNAELSDANGSFATPVIIGSYTGTNSAIIAAKLPNTVVGGTNFRVRVSSTNPVVTGLSGSNALTIGNRSVPQTITGPVNVNGTLNYNYNVPAVTGSTWNWIIAEGNKTSGGTTNSIGVTWNQPVSPTSPGTIKLVETNYNCVGDTSILTATIYKLRIGISAPASACKAFSITVNASADGAFSAGNTLTAQLSNATGSFASPVSIGSVSLVGNGLNQAAVINGTIPANIPNGTDYRVRIMSSTGSFVGDTSAAVSIMKPDLGTDQAITKCPGFPVDLTTLFTTTGLTVQWNVASPESVVATGVYQIIVTNTNGCKDTANVTVTNFPKPNIGPDISRSKCVGFLYNLAADFNAAGLTYTYSGGTATVDAGSYTVIATNSNGCKDTAIVTVSNYPKPNLGADKSVSKCIGFTTDLGGLFTTTGLTVEWNTATPSAADAGTYRIIATNTDGCKDTAFATVSNYPKPNLGADKSITASCAGGTADITSVYSTGAYSNVTYNVANPQQAPLGTYTLIVTNSNGCKDTAIITVLDASIVTVPTTPNNTKIASRECTDGQGWTHYYNDNGTPSDYSDDIRLLSLKKNGNSIGTVGVGPFEVKVAATQGAGSGHAVNIVSPLVTGGNSFYSMNRYWNITPTTQPVTPVNIRFYYNTQDLADVNGDYPGNNVDHSKLNMYKLQGGNPDPTTNWAGATSVTFYDNGSEPSLTKWVYSNLANNAHQAEFQVASLSGGGAGATEIDPLPVTLVKFDVVGERDKVKLLWSTATEVNTKAFDVQRSLDGSSFTSIGKVSASGNSTTLTNYQFNDAQAIQFKGMLVYYRILQTDLNGQGKYTDVKMIRIAKQTSSLSLLYNPVRYEAVLKYDCVDKGKVMIRVIDLAGRIVMMKEVVADAGMNQMRLNISRLAQGMYEVEVIGSKDHQHVRIVKE